MLAAGQEDPLQKLSRAMMVATAVRFGLAGVGAAQTGNICGTSQGERRLVLLQQH